MTALRETALITGASSGIGAAFAHQLAARSLNLVLVARSADRLAALATELADRHGIATWAIAQDLSQPGAAAELLAQIHEQGLAIDWLINNAGFGDYGPFAESQGDRQTAMVNLNITALMELTHGLLPAMQGRGRGVVVNVASTAAFQPLPYLALYAATKAFVLSFSEALWAECRSSGVEVLALCPGPTSTEFFRAANFPDSAAPSLANSATPEEVVSAALEAIASGKANVVTGGLGNQVLVNTARFLPRSTLVEAIAKAFRPKGIQK